MRSRILLALILAVNLAVPALALAQVPRAKVKRRGAVRLAPLSITKVCNMQRLTDGRLQGTITGTGPTMPSAEDTYCRTHTCYNVRGVWYSSSIYGDTGNPNFAVLDKVKDILANQRGDSCGRVRISWWCDRRDYCQRFPWYGVCR